jgi:hypothetical protein
MNVFMFLNPFRNKISVNLTKIYQNSCTFHWADTVKKLSDRCEHFSFLRDTLHWVWTTFQTFKFTKFSNFSFFFRTKRFKVTFYAVKKLGTVASILFLKKERWLPNLRQTYSQNSQSEAFLRLGLFDETNYK